MKKQEFKNWKLPLGFSNWTLPEKYKKLPFEAQLRVFYTDKEGAKRKPTRKEAMLCSAYIAQFTEFNTFFTAVYNKMLEIEKEKRALKNMKDRVKKTKFQA